MCRVFVYTYLYIRRRRCVTKHTRCITTRIHYTDFLQIYALNSPVFLTNNEEENEGTLRNYIYMCTSSIYTRIVLSESFFHRILSYGHNCRMLFPKKQ